MGCALEKKSMLCPYCQHSETRVIDKRDSGEISRRRRECLKCSRRFNTQESVEKAELRVIKKDGRRESFDPEKLKRGLMKACEKRQITTEMIEKMVRNVEDKLLKQGKEAKSSTIGTLASNELKRADKVAYIRFASVYKEFADISDFKREIKEILDK